MKYNNQFEYKAYGDYALFSDPVTRVGWKPTLLYIIDEVKILNPIRTVSKGIRPIKYNGGNDLSMYTYLHDVAYAVRGRFIWNKNHPELAQDRNKDKHFQILKRMIARGGRRDIFLGTRECQAYVEPCRFDEEKSFYSDGELSFGLMYHSLIYADEAICDEDKGKLTVCFHSPVMKNGVIRLTPPEKCSVKRHIKPAKIKVFDSEHLMSADVLYEEVKQLELVE